MKGISEYRRGGPDDPLVNEIMREKGLSEVPQFRRDNPKTKHFNVLDVIKRWDAYTPHRDGRVNSEKPEGTDPSHLAALIREKAIALGASDIGFAALTPIMINQGSEFDGPNIISIIVGEEYTKSLEGAVAVEMEAYESYVDCARIATELAEYVRGLGFSGIAEHNGTGDIQAIPALYASGLGELGKHGSIVHPDLGPSFRPSFVITDAPLELAAPNIFGVQATCENCRICEQNCPPAAIRSSDDFIVTEGIKRWIVDIRRCFEASRFRDEYCHICVDVCPYQHKANGDPIRRETYKAVLRKRKAAGYRTPTWFIEDEEKVLGVID